MGESTGTSTEERALSLLGAGVSAESTAAALGVSVSRISQLLSTEEFSSKVSELRFKNLSKHNERDSVLDSLEDKILERLDNSMGLCVRPMELTRMLQVVNAAKRRGSSTPEAITEKQQVVQLTMPTNILNNFSVQVNINNQVTQVGEQSLLTIQSGALLKTVEAARIESLGSKVIEGSTRDTRDTRTTRGEGNEQGSREVIKRSPS